MSQRNRNDTPGPRIKKETRIKKSSAVEYMSAGLTVDRRLKDYFRVFVGGPQGDNALEVVLHHPVGITDLSDGSWVASSPHDLAQLLERTKDPDQEVIFGERSTFIRNKAIDNGCILVNGDGKIELGNTGVLRSMFLKDFEKFVKEQHTEKNFKFNLSAALVMHPDYVGVQYEAEYARVKVHFSKAAVEGFPQTFRTLSGCLNDKAQEALVWLYGKSQREAVLLVFKHGLTGPTTAPEMNSDEVECTTVPQDGQWCFLPSGLNAAQKKEARDAGKILTKALGADNASQFEVIVRRKQTK